MGTVEAMIMGRAPGAIQLAGVLAVQIYKAHPGFLTTPGHIKLVEIMENEKILSKCPFKYIYPFELLVT